MSETARPGLHPDSLAWPHLRVGWVAAGLAGIVLAGLALRLAGITYGLPVLLYPDEWYVVTPALHVATTGSLDPVRLDYGSAYIYGLAVVFRLAAMVGLIPPLASLPAYDLINRPDYYPVASVFLLARVVATVINLLGVVLLYRVGRRLFGPAVGLLAAAFLSLSWLGVQMARYGVTESALTTTVVVALWATLRVLERASWQRVAVAALVVGVAASVKYTLVGLAVPLGVAYLVSRSRPQGWWGPLLAFALVPLGFVLTTPYAVLDLPRFLDNLAVHQRASAWDASGYVEGPSAVWYVQYLLSHGDASYAALGLVGLAALARSRWRLALVLALFPLTFWGIISLSGVRYTRYLMPMLPALALTAGWALLAVGQRLAHRRWLAPLLVTLALAWPLAADLALLRVLYQPDTRALAAAWLAQNAPGRPVATDIFGPAQELVTGDYVRVTTVTEHPPAWYAERGMTVLAGDVWRLHFSRTRAEMEKLAAWEADPALEFVTHIDGQMWGYPEYGIRIYQPRR